MRRRVFKLRNAVLRHLAAPGLALLIGIGGAAAQSVDSKAQDQSGKPAAGRPVALTVADILGLVAPTRKMLIEKLLPTPGAVLLVGAHKSGKTVLAIQMAVAVASGHALFDYYRVPEKAGIGNQGTPGAPRDS